MRKPIVAAALLALVGALSIYASSRAALLINGAGATFPYPIYSKWFDIYAKQVPEVKFNYQSIGSGGGIRMLSNRTVDIGASDAPMSDDQLKAAPGKILHFPSVMGAVVIAYNLPAADIVVAHRSDGSGTSYIFTDYLSKVSPAWASGVGKSTAVKWPVGLGGKGNEGVTALVQQTPGAIGYIELIYALSNHIPFTDLKNHDGNWVKASLEGVTAAAASAAANMPSDLRVSITDASGASAYPISSFTYLLVFQQQSKRDVGEQVKRFINWALHEGQQYAPPLNYAPLPAPVVELASKQLDTIELPAK